MSGSRILITGANGQLGRALQTIYPEALVTSIDELDITNRDSIANFDWSSIDVILNAAAYTNVDGAETPEGCVAAWQVNASAVKYLAQAATNHSLTLVHISTDYVFDGSKEEHTEDESFSPLGVYGASKAAGDVVATLTKRHYILRTSWVIGEGNNFVRTMMNLAQRDISPIVVSDQIGRLTFTQDLARGIQHLLNTKAPYGTYNLTNSGESCSWADVTRAIFKQLKREDLNVTNTSTAEYFKEKPESAPRPLHSTLLLDKIVSSGFVPRDWREALNEYVAKN